jgi:glutamyl-tRNA synthetase
MSIANSNFEEWSIANKSFDLSAFPFSLNKMSLDGALFDLDKLSYFAKEMMAKESAASLLPKVKEWALVHNEAFYKRIDSNEAYFAKILNIEKNRPNPRKDYAKFSDIEPLTRFFYYEEWEQIVAKGLPFNPKFQKADLASLLRDLGEHMIYGSDEMTWWAGVKDIAKAHKFAESNKDYKANPSAYLGSVSDAAEILRVSLTGSVQSPNLHEILEILGKNEVAIRLEKVASLLK